MISFCTCSVSILYWTWAVMTCPMTRIVLRAGPERPQILHLIDPFRCLVGNAISAVNMATFKQTVRYAPNSNSQALKREGGNRRKNWLTFPQQSPSDVIRLDVDWYGPWMEAWRKNSSYFVRSWAMRYFPRENCHFGRQELKRLLSRRKQLGHDETHGIEKTRSTTSLSQKTFAWFLASLGSVFSWAMRSHAVEAHFKGILLYRGRF